jgi:hypothetical protein
LLSIDLVDTLLCATDPKVDRFELSALAFPVIALAVDLYMTSPFEQTNKDVVSRYTL